MPTKPLQPKQGAANDGTRRSLRLNQPPSEQDTASKATQQPTAPQKAKYTPKLRVEYVLVKETAKKPTYAKAATPAQQAKASGIPSAKVVIIEPPPQTDDEDGYASFSGATRLPVVVHHECQLDSLSLVNSASFPTPPALTLENFPLLKRATRAATKASAPTSTLQVQPNANTIKSRAATTAPKRDAANRNGVQALKTAHKPDPRDTKVEQVKAPPPKRGPKVHRVPRKPEVLEPVTEDGIPGEGEDVEGAAQQTERSTQRRGTHLPEVPEVESEDNEGFSWNNSSKPDHAIRQPVRQQTAVEEDKATKRTQKATYNSTRKGEPQLEDREVDVCETKNSAKPRGSRKQKLQENESDHEDGPGEKANTKRNATRKPQPQEEDDDEDEVLEGEKETMHYGSRKQQPQQERNAKDEASIGNKHTKRKEIRKPQPRDEGEAEDKASTGNKHTKQKESRKPQPQEEMYPEDRASIGNKHTKQKEKRKPQPQEEMDTDGPSTGREHTKQTGGRKSRLPGAPEGKTPRPRNYNEGTQASEDNGDGPDGIGSFKTPHNREWPEEELSTDGDGDEWLDIPSVSTSLGAIKRKDLQSLKASDSRATDVFTGPLPGGGRKDAHYKLKRPTWTVSGDEGPSPCTGKLAPKLGATTARLAPGEGGDGLVNGKGREKVADQEVKNDEEKMEEQPKIPRCPHFLCDLAPDPEQNIAYTSETAPIHHLHQYQTMRESLIPSDDVKVWWQFGRSCSYASAPPSLRFTGSGCITERPPEYEPTGREELVSFFDSATEYWYYLPSSHYIAESNGDHITPEDVKRVEETAQDVDRWIRLVRLMFRIEDTPSRLVHHCHIKDIPLRSDHTTQCMPRLPLEVPSVTAEIRALFQQTWQVLNKIVDDPPASPQPEWLKDAPVPLEDDIDGCSTPSGSSYGETVRLKRKKGDMSSQESDDDMSQADESAKYSVKRQKKKAKVVRQRARKLEGGHSVRSDPPSDEERRVKSVRKAKEKKQRQRSRRAGSLARRDTVEGGVVPIEQGKKRARDDDGQVPEAGRSKAAKRSRRDSQANTDHEHQLEEKARDVRSQPDGVSGNLDSDIEEIGPPVDGAMEGNGDVPPEAPVVPNASKGKGKGKEKCTGPTINAKASSSGIKLTASQIDMIQSMGTNIRQLRDELGLPIYKLLDLADLALKYSRASNDWDVFQAWFALKVPGQSFVGFATTAAEQYRGWQKKYPGEKEWKLAVQTWKDDLLQAKYSRNMSQEDQEVEVLKFMEEVCEQAQNFIVGVGDLAPVHIVAAVFSSDRLAQQKNTMLTNQRHFHKLLTACGVQVDEALDRMATLAKSFEMGAMRAEDLSLDRFVSLVLGTSASDAPAVRGSDPLEQEDTPLPDEALPPKPSKLPPQSKLGKVSTKPAKVKKESKAAGDDIEDFRGLANFYRTSGIFPDSLRSTDERQTERNIARMFIKGCICDHFDTALPKLPKAGLWRVPMLDFLLKNRLQFVCPFDLPVLPGDPRFEPSVFDRDQSKAFVEAAREGLIFLQVWDEKYLQIAKGQDRKYGRIPLVLSNDGQTLKMVSDSVGWNLALASSMAAANAVLDNHDKPLALARSRGELGKDVKSLLKHGNRVKLHNASMVKRFLKFRETETGDLVPVSENELEEEESGDDMQEEE